jgi:type IV pilus assembly protein PilF
MQRKLAIISATAFTFVLANCGACLAAALEKPLSYKAQMAVEVAQEFVRQNKYDEAIKQADIAIRSDPKSGVPYMVKGFILDRKNQYSKATDAFTKAVKLSPNNGFVLNAFGVHLCDQKQYVKADAAFLQASLDNNYPLAYQALENAGQCALANENNAVAEERARAALAINAERASALETMTQVKFKQGNFFEARAFMQRREALGPLSISLLQLAQQLETSAGDNRAAAQYQKQLDTLLQDQIQPPTGEGQKKP